MAMSIPLTARRRASLSGVLWRKPLLGLLLLLLAPLMWFGIVYLGSLLTLLWQGFYTFDDFTMAVTPDLTLANLQALFNPANYDIILRTLTMAIAVTMASAILAFPMAWYMARYTRGKWKAFFYIAVMLPMWASYIVKAYAWTLLLAKDGVAQWFLQPSGTGAAANRLPDAARRRRQHPVHLRAGALPGVRLYLAAVYDPADPGGAGAPAALAAAGLGRPGRASAPDLPLCRAAAGHTGHCGRVDFHLLPDAGRFHRAAAGGAAGLLHRQHGLRAAGRDRQYADGRRLYAGAHRADCPLSGVRETSGSIRCTLNAHRCS